MANGLENTAEGNVLNEMGYYLYDTSHDELIRDYWDKQNQDYYRKSWDEPNIMNQKLAEISLLLGGPMIKDDIDYSNWFESQEKDKLGSPLTGYTNPYPIIKPYGLSFGGSGLAVDIDLLSLVEKGNPGFKFSTNEGFSFEAGSGRKDEIDPFITTRHDIPAPADKWRFGKTWRF